MIYQLFVYIAASIKKHNIEPRQIKATWINILVLLLMPLPYTKPHLVEFRCSILDNGYLGEFRKACRRNQDTDSPILGDRW